MIKHILYCFLISQLLCCKQKTDPAITEKIGNKLTEKSEIKTPSISGDTIQGDFNGDKIKDYIEIGSSSANQKKMKIFLGTRDQKFEEEKFFTIDADYFQEVDRPMENFFISQGKPGEIQIGSSCCGNFKTTEVYLYKYLNGNWFLSQTTFSMVQDDFIPDIILTMNDLSYSIDGKTVNNKTAYEKELGGLKANALSRYKEYLSAFRSGYQSKTLGKLNSISFNEIAEILYFNPISPENVNDYNDLAFYNSSTKKGQESSIILLKKILDKYPDRVVAYLNLADVYWAIDQKEFAREAYKKYLEHMKNQNKDLSKIPPRVEERIK